MDDFDDQIKQTTKNPWYAVRTFNCQELKITLIPQHFDLTLFISS